ncbi:restriction endonuclease [Mucilaginibacter gilvus]|uniref:Restriction endonuclease n=1 Tax=Mucilaginibacter gilvus TaxID=2305909 RepID=A0A3S3X348_9SPHI|nr:restriction endonuclease [Mucilaginibacter gilvus]RWY49497.1 restriction endonuclease [Mucilaginibacter gilvus]
MHSNQNKVRYYQKNTSTWRVTFCAELSHIGLSEFKIFKDSDQTMLERKVTAQFQKWDEKWLKIQQSLSSQQFKEGNTKYAEEQTKEYQTLHQRIDNILIEAVDVDNTITWETIKDKKRFPEKNPFNEIHNELAKIKDPIKPSVKPIPKAPHKSNLKYQPIFTFSDKIFKSSKEKKILTAESVYKFDYHLWEKQKKSIEVDNKTAEDKYHEQLQVAKDRRVYIEENLLKEEQDWVKRKNDYLQSQIEFNAKIDVLKQNYLSKDAAATVEYCDMVLTNSEYPDLVKKDFDLEYNPKNSILIVDYVLPSSEDFPKVSEVRYIATKKELKEYAISEAQLAKVFDATMYNITLRTIHELYQADTINALEAIVFNGWINYINKATGKDESSCILSIQIKKSDFVEINLKNIDPKICFKNFKGVGSSKLYGITPIRPLLHIDKNDKRFVSSHDVAGLLDEGSNLATMPWEEFEHLIREIFAKEFSHNGGEVKVTQASRDGGVDAIAFDPDPIRGGKIVIQAKRYTNTVGVAAVRDLYGTVHNEGANKGILVTTSDYGPDAYEFVKSKPLTLINGANLLYLLEKHGHKARINIKEAREISNKQ